MCVSERETVCVCVHQCMFCFCVHTLNVSNVNIALVHMMRSTTVPGREQVVEYGYIVKQQSRTIASG